MENPETLQLLSGKDYAGVYTFGNQNINSAT